MYRNVFRYSQRVGNRQTEGIRPSKSKNRKFFQEMSPENDLFGFLCLSVSVSLSLSPSVCLFLSSFNHSWMAIHRQTIKIVVNWNSLLNVMSKIAFILKGTVNLFAFQENKNRTRIHQSFKERKDGNPNFAFFYCILCSLINI